MQRAARIAPRRVAFLQHDYNEAAFQFGVAARRARLAKYNTDLSVEEAALNRGVALLRRTGSPRRSPCCDRSIWVSKVSRIRPR